MLPGTFAPGIPLILPRCIPAGLGPLIVGLAASPEPTLPRGLVFKFDRVGLRGLDGGLPLVILSLRVTMCVRGEA